MIKLNKFLNRVRVMLLIALLSTIAIADADLGGIISADYLSPHTAINQVGTTHTVVATIINSSGPIPNLKVLFAVSGINNGTNGSDITDSAGKATFTYRDIGGVGTDQIQAAVFLGPPDKLQVPIFSNIVTKKWVFLLNAGLMQGQDNFFANPSVKLKFELRCNLNDKPNNLEINWKDNRFELNELTSAACFNDSSIHTSKAGFNTYVGTGTGTYNGVDKADASWTFTDVEKHGINDTVSMVIKDSNGNDILNISGILDKGDQKAKK